MRAISNGYVRKDRSYWRAVICYQDGGKQHKVSKTTKVRCYPDKVDDDGNVLKADNRGKGAAEDFLRRWREELIAEMEPSPEARPYDKTLFEYANNYYDLLHVKKSTKDGYHAALSHLVGTKAGNSKMGELSAEDLYRWEQDMYEDGLSENTVAHYHAFVAQVLKHAVAEGTIARTPVGHMRAPRRRPKPVNALSNRDFSKVRRQLGMMERSPLTIAATLALATGMRRAEICALRWLDVDLDSRVIHVTHALTKDHGFKLDTPKDPSGGDATRDIEFGPGLREALADHKESMRLDVLDAGGEWDESLFVIGTVDGRWKGPESLGREWSMLVRTQGWKGTQGLPIRFHDLRHAFATVAIANGMDVMVLAKILGHRDATTTLNVYATALAEAKRTGMERMDQIVFQQTTARGKHFV